MNSSTAPTQSLRVLIAGGGVAALEAALALRELAGDRVATTLLAPEPEFAYRPMRVREPFGYGLARRYALEEVAQDLDAELVQGALKWLDPYRSVLHTDRGQDLPYDALLLALGARLRPAFAHAITIDDREIDEQLHGLIQDIEGGYVGSVAFIAPSPMPWPLPIYELALMTAARAYDMGVDVAITIATPEETPLALFGARVSDRLKRLLDARGIVTVGSARCSISQPGVVSIHPGDRTLRVDRVVALPQLFGPSVPGVPSTSKGGFIEIDHECRVRRLDRVWAAGDATDFPVKHGAVAAQQADTSAAAIAALAGARVQPIPFRPEIRAVLIGAEEPLYLSAHLTGGHGSDSTIDEQPAFSPPAKISARYLSPYLEARDRAALR